MKQKFLRLSMMVIAMMACVSSFAYDAEIDGIYYNLNDSAKTAEVTYHDFNPVDVVYNSNYYKGKILIPETVIYDGVTYSVTSIGIGAFYDCSGLTSITIGNSVTSIGDYAFQYCTGLTSITIPNSVTSIGSSAFLECNNMTELIYNAKNSTVNNSPRYDRSFPTSLKSVVIGDEVESIPAYFVNNCTDIVSITIPNSVTSIGKTAFYRCSGLKSIIIPSSVTNIDNGTFCACTGLTSVTIPNSVTSIGYMAFDGCTSLTSITFPNSVTSIDGQALNYCTALKSVTIGNSVTNIGDRTFCQCAQLREIHSNNVTPPATGTDCFKDVKTANCKLYVPIGHKDDYAFADGWSDFVNIIEEEVKNTEGDKQCATPTIALVNGKLTFKSETPDAKYHYTIEPQVSKIAESTYQESVDLTPVTSYIVTCFASAEGYADSETATATFTIDKSDVNMDGQVDISDVNGVISVICGE